MKFQLNFTNGKERSQIYNLLHIFAATAVFYFEKQTYSNRGTQITFSEFLTLKPTTAKKEGGLILGHTVAAL